MEGEEEPYELSIENMIQQVEAFDWSDLEGSPEAVIPENPFITTAPPQQYRRFYQLFRAVLNNEEASPRSYLLSTLILRLKSTNYYALMLRSRYFFSSEQDLAAIEREVYFANCLLSLNAKEYQVWTYKKQLFKRFSDLVGQSLMLYHGETEFLDYLLDQDCKNYHVWDYKLWLTQFFRQEEQEISYTATVLFRGVMSVEEIRQQFEGLGVDVQQIDMRNCYSLWSYRYNLRQAVANGKQGAQLALFQQEEVGIMREWLGKEGNLTNQCGWNYLTGLVLQAKTTSQLLLREFLQTALEIFNRTKNRFAGSTVIQLADELEAKYGEKVEEKRAVITELIASDRVRKLYYEYLLEESV